jgi:hypothetical protein
VTPWTPHLPLSPPARTRPSSLRISAARAFNAIAFLGAGFLGHLGAQFASWAKLLRAIIKETSPAVCEELTRLLDMGGADATVFQRVAQQAEDDLGEKALQEVASRLLELPRAVYCEDACRLLSAEEGARVHLFRKRLALIRLLPFRAILTTNFTSFGSGARVVSLPQGGAEAALRELLRGAPRMARVGEAWLQWQEQLLRCFNDEGRSPPPPWGEEDPLIIHIHGTCASPVVTKLGYRALLHRTPAYLPFMRTLMTTHTLVYVGFSFTDAYLDEVRSEALSMLSAMTRGGAVGGEGGRGGCGGCCGGGVWGGGGAASLASPGAAGAAPALLSPLLPEPLAFALMPLPAGVGGSAGGEASLLSYHRRHEGVAWLAYEVPCGTHDHSRCDALLEDLIRKVCIPFRLARALRGRRLLVFDKMREGFAESCVPLLSKLVLSTVGRGEARDALLARFDAAAATQAKYVRRYDAKKLLEAAEDRDVFVPPERPPEEWPLAEGGKIEVVFLNRGHLLARLCDAGLPASFPAPCVPAYDEEGRSEADIGELTFAGATCGQRQLRKPDGSVVALPTPPDTDTQSTPRQQRTFAALVTLSGYRGAARRSMYMNTLSIVRSLPIRRRFSAQVSSGSASGTEWQSLAVESLR